MTYKEDVIKCHLRDWLLGLYSEIEFWKEFMFLKGGIYSSKWEETINCERKFTLEDDIPEKMYGKQFDFVDIGSGPFSRCGIITDKVGLNHTAVDPLADAYNLLKKKAGLKTKINLQSGFVELLDRIFEKNSFDLVHMSNSLDHSFYPILGIYQLIYICRVGGKIILRHKENEAYNGSYEGLHQWNLSVDLDTNKFLIWRNKQSYCINEIFDEYVDIKCSKDPLEDIFYRVEMVKKKDIKIPKSNLYDIMLKEIYSFMVLAITNNAINGFDSLKTLHIDGIVNVINDTSDKELKSIFNQKGWKKVVIYGLGKVGKKLLDRLYSTNIEVVELIDRQTVSYLGRTSITFDDYIYKDDVDLIIYTPFSGFEIVKSMLEDKGVNVNKILPIKEVFI